MGEVRSVFFNWSTGKDSALALYHALRDPRYRVGHLLTTLNTHHDRVTMHGLRRALFEQQVEALGLPWSTVELPEMPDMSTYELVMESALAPLREAGYTHAAFGDIFLEDLKAYREEKLKAAGLEAVFPLWQRDTAELAREFVDLGFRAVVLATQADVLDESFVGREYDAAFLEGLPAGVDPCGENGEFHTFCYAGPLFAKPIAFHRGEKVLRTYPAPKKKGEEEAATLGVWYQDLLPA